MPLAKDSSLTGGALRGRTGPLVPVRFTGSMLAAGSGFTCSAADTAANPDGSARFVSMVAPSGNVNGYALVRDRVRGTTVAIRGLFYVNTPKLDAIIDGVVYRLDRTRPLWNNMTTSIAADTVSSFVVAENLPFRDHTVELVLLADPGGSATSFAFYGWAGDHAAGNTQPAFNPIRSVLSTATTLTTSLAALPTAQSSFAKKLRFHNSDSVQRVVTVTGTDGTTTLASIVLTASGTNGDSFALDIGDAKNIASMKWKADAGSVVSAFLELA